MPFENALVVGAIVAAFVTFGVVVAYVSKIAARRPDHQAAE